MTSKYKEIAFWWNKNSNRLSEVGYVAGIFTYKISKDNRLLQPRRLFSDISLSSKKYFSK